jgi:hypothetical protein
MQFTMSIIASINNLIPFSRKQTIGEKLGRCVCITIYYVWPARSQQSLLSKHDISICVFVSIHSITKALYAGQANTGDDWLSL